MNSNSTRASYDMVAAEYGRRISGELEGKPLDRALLSMFVELHHGARVADLGCGPGHVTADLSTRDLEVTGLDLSPGMLEEARRRFPNIPFVQGDMLGTLPFEDHELGGIIAFYSLIHIPREHIGSALVECRRVTAPGGSFLLSFHIGDADTHLDEWWGHEVDVTFTFYELDEMKHHLTKAGWLIDLALERAPYPGIEHESQRGYILARHPTTREPVVT